MTKACNILSLLVVSFGWYFWIVCDSVVFAFVVQIQPSKGWGARCCCDTTTQTFLSSSVGPYDSQDQQQQPENNDGGLLLDSDALHGQMESLRGKYPTQEADYLAAARARSQAKVASTERQATDADYHAAAEERRKMVNEGDLDDWEASAKEAGNADSQILIPMDTDGEEDPEPKLMLF